MLGGELVCKEVHDVGPVDELERENEREELEPGRVWRIDRQGDPLWGDTAAKSEGGLLGIGHRRAGLEKIRLLDSGEDVEVRERGEHKHAYDTLYRGSRHAQRYRRQRARDKHWSGVGGGGRRKEAGRKWNKGSGAVR